MAAALNYCCQGDTRALVAFRSTAVHQRVARSGPQCCNFREHGRARVHHKAGGPSYISHEAAGTLAGRVLQCMLGDQTAVSREENTHTHTPIFLSSRRN